MGIWWSGDVLCSGMIDCMRERGGMNRVGFFGVEEAVNFVVALTTYCQEIGL